MPTVVPQLNYSKWAQWKTVVAWCEEGALIFSDEQGCCDDPLDFTDFFEVTCDGGGILTLSDDCKTLTVTTLDEIMDNVDTDVLVKVSADDDCAQYLKNKIRDSKYIKIEEDQEWSCEVLRPVLDFDKIKEDLEDWGDCSDCDKFVKPMAVLALSSDYEINMSADQQADDEYIWYRWFPTIGYRNNNWTGRTDWIEFDTIGSDDNNISNLTTIKIKYTGDYLINMWFNCDGNRGIQAMRWIVFTDDPDQPVIIDVKDISNSPEFSWNKDANDAEDLKQAGFHASKIIRLKEGTRVFMGCRVDPAVRDEPGWTSSWHDVKLIIRKAGLSGWVLNQWNTLQNAECGTFLDVIRMNDESGSILYG